MKFRHSDFLEDVTEHFVIWSGGCDSTLLLYNLAKTYRANPGIKITAMSIDHYLVATPEKRIAEAEHRKRFMEAMKRRGLNNIKYFEVKVTGEERFNPGNYGLMQASMWAGLISPYVPIGAALYFGYIRGDDIWHYIHEFENILKNHMTLSGKDIKLCTPYEFTRKEEIISRLFEEGLFEYTWCCETPTNPTTPCGICTSCETQQKALLTIATLWSQQWAKDLLGYNISKKETGVSDLVTVKRDEESSSIISGTTTHAEGNPSTTEQFEYSRTIPSPFGDIRIHAHQSAGVSSPHRQTPMTGYGCACCGRGAGLICSCTTSSKTEIGHAHASQSIHHTGNPAVTGFQKDGKIEIGGLGSPDNYVSSADTSSCAYRCPLKEVEPVFDLNCGSSPTNQQGNGEVTEKCYKYQLDVTENGLRGSLEKVDPQNRPPGTITTRGV